MKIDITQKPHPWIVFNNRETLLAYHKLQGENHITQLKSCDAEYSIILQTEAAYHICAAFLIQYDDYSGCTETSPIIILANAVNHLNNISSNKPLPVQKFQVIQLKKDLVRHEIPFEQFIKNINIVYRSIVIEHLVTQESTKNALLELWGILLKIEQPQEHHSDNLSPLEKCMRLFDSATGFIVKAHLRELESCFWVEPNWEQSEASMLSLGKQFLVCVLNRSNSSDLIYDYLYKHTKRQHSSEIVFLKEDFAQFNHTERNQIRSSFRGEFIRCIFVQKQDFSGISREKELRSIFLKIIQHSKIS